MLGRTATLAHAIAPAHTPTHPPRSFTSLPTLAPTLPPRPQACISNSTQLTKSYDIVNVDRSSLGRVGGAIAKK